MSWVNIALSTFFPDVTTFLLLTVLLHQHFKNLHCNVTKRSFQMCLNSVSIKLKLFTTVLMPCWPKRDPHATEYNSRSPVCFKIEQTVCKTVALCKVRLKLTQHEMKTNRRDSRIQKYFRNMSTELQHWLPMLSKIVMLNLELKTLVGFFLLRTDTDFKMNFSRKGTAKAI